MLGRKYILHVRPRLPGGEFDTWKDEVIIGSDKHRYYMTDRWLPHDYPLEYPDKDFPPVVAIKSAVNEGDKVIVIGGGNGLTPAVAAKLSGQGGRVLIFEGAKQQVEVVGRTMTLNNLSDITEVRHALVGPPIALYGAPVDAEKFDIGELPECDVIEMNVEGAELEILRNLKVRPRVMIIGIHTRYGVSEADVLSELERMDYTVKPAPGSSFGESDPYIVAKKNRKNQA